MDAAGEWKIGAAPIHFSSGRCRVLGIGKERCKKTVLPLSCSGLEYCYCASFAGFSWRVDVVTPNNVLALAQIPPHTATIHVNVSSYCLFRLRILRTLPIVP